MKKQLKILFFIKDAVPTALDYAKASELPAQVCFRNAAYIEDASEPCDGVAGVVPNCYKAFPKAEKAIAAYQAELKALSAKLGDEAAPKKATEPPKDDGEPPKDDEKPPAGTGAKPPPWNPAKPA